MQVAHRSYLVPFLLAFLAVSNGCNWSVMGKPPRQPHLGHHLLLPVQGWMPPRGWHLPLLVACGAHKHCPVPTPAPVARPPENRWARAYLIICPQRLPYPFFLPQTALPMLLWFVRWRLALPRLEKPRQSLSAWVIGWSHSQSNLRGCGQKRRTSYMRMDYLREHEGN